MNGEVETGVTTMSGLDVIGGGVVGNGVEVAGSGVGDAGTGVAVKGTGVGVEGLAVGELGVMAIVAIAVAGAATASNGRKNPHTAITLTKRARITDIGKDVFRVLMRRTYQEGDNATYRGETRGND